jgi:hypothetical protein
MRRNLPVGEIGSSHPDFSLLAELESEILLSAGGADDLRHNFPSLLRECIDDVIQTPRTGRRSYDELEKTEKTYIGTRVEIMLRSFLRAQKGDLGLRIGRFDVDVKHTMGSNWMIPTETVGHPCVLLAADEEHALCYMGIVVARPEYLTAGPNQDAKRSLSAVRFQNIRWLLRELPYPANFWRTVDAAVVERIFLGRSGNERVTALFAQVRDRPISRNVIEAVAQQKDFMRRIRADKGSRGTRGALGRQGMVLMSGDYDSHFAHALGLPRLGKGEFMSHLIADEGEAQLARSAGYEFRWPIN